MAQIDLVVAPGVYTPWNGAVDIGTPTAANTGANSQNVQGAYGNNTNATPNPVTVGAMAFSGLQTLNTGRTGRMIVDLSARLQIKPLGPPQLQLDGRLSIGTTVETAVIAATAAQRTDLQSATICNRDTVAHTVDIRDALAGTIRDTVMVQPGATFQLTYPAGRANTAVNTAWTAQLREVQATNPVEINMTGFACN